MRSTLKTTAAVLRSITGLNTDDFSKLVMSSPSAIKSVESGRLPLSKSLAARMAAATGISEGWLLAGAPKKAPTTPSGLPFGLEEFAAHTAMRTFHQETASTRLYMRSLHLAGRLCAILARSVDSRNYELAVYKAGRLVDELGKEFGEDETCVLFPEKAADQVRQLVDLYDDRRAEARRAQDPAAPTDDREREGMGETEMRHAESTAALGYIRLMNLTKDQYDKDSAESPQRSEDVTSAQQSLRALREAFEAGRARQAPADNETERDERGRAAQQERYQAALAHRAAQSAARAKQATTTAEVEAETKIQNEIARIAAESAAQFAAENAALPPPAKPPAPKKKKKRK